MQEQFEDFNAKIQGNNDPSDAKIQGNNARKKKKASVS